MLSRACQRLLGGSGCLMRQFTASASTLEGELSSKESFSRKLAEVAPNLTPAYPTEFLPHAKIGSTEGPTPTKLKLTFSMPHKIVMSDVQVDLALLPAVTGDFGVMPGHVPVVAELRPGIVAIHTELDKEVQKYFVSGGFATAHADSSVEVTVVEAVKLDDLDPAAVKTGLAEYTARLANASSKNDDLEAAIAQVGVEVYSAMNNALQ